MQPHSCPTCKSRCQASSGLCLAGSKFSSLSPGQYEQAADSELAWVAETKRKLMALGPIRLEQDQTTAQLQVQKVRDSGLNGWSELEDKVVLLTMALQKSR